ncbi:unnamed protein product, partial [Rotaria sp. Silwood2]
DTSDRDHYSQLFKLKRIFKQVEDADNGGNIYNLIEIFKILMNIQSLKFRLKCAISTLTDLKNDNQIHIKATVIKTFLNNESYEKAVLRLTKTYNIHLLKHIPGDKKGIIYILSNFNSSFKSFVNYLKKLEIEFNIDSELAPGFNIPYYLSLILLDKRPDNPDENYSEETNEITMSILFKGFNCSTDEDKEYFLKDKDDILKEFNNICESVKRIIQFYRTNDGTKRERNEGFRDLSIKHILNGFSLTNRDSLHDRKEYARKLI